MARGGDNGGVDPASAADRAARREQLLGALADAVEAVDRAPPVQVAVDGPVAAAAAGLADDLAGALTARGRRCRRVSLGTPVRVPDPRPRGDDVVVVDGSLLQHPRLGSPWDLVIYLRQPIQPIQQGSDPDRARALARYLAETREAAMAAFTKSWEWIRNSKAAPYPLRGQTGKHLLSPSFTGFGPQAVFGSIHRTCLSALVTDRAMEAWYHPSIA